jgi:glycosyltransferase involved in cell wall biosynthesis
MDQPLVSANIVTYNQARYIGQAIEGALRQDTDFGVEIVVGEDCSTDDTRAIVLEYERMHPQRVRVVLSERNVGARQNSRHVREVSRGKYVAFCDGDDYWTDPHKLQKQVDFLEAHPEYSLCCHDVDIIFDGVPQTPRTDRYLDCAADTFTFEDAVQAHFIPTLSVVCPREPTLHVPDWYYECISGDIPMELLLLDTGPGYYLHERMGVKRDNPGSISLDRRRAARAATNFLRMYENMDRYTEGRHRRVLHGKIAGLSLKLARENLSAGHLVPFLRYAAKSFRYDREALYHAVRKRSPFRRRASHAPQGGSRPSDGPPQVGAREESRPMGI